MYKSTRDSEFFDFDLVCVTSTNYNKICFYLENLNICRLLVDEVETIKIPASKEVRAEFTWFISSSIKILQNPKGVYVLEEYQSWYYQQKRCFPFLFHYLSN